MIADVVQDQEDHTSKRVSLSIARSIICLGLVQTIVHFFRQCQRLFWEKIIASKWPNNSHSGTYFSLLTHKWIAMPIAALSKKLCYISVNGVNYVFLYFSEGGQLCIFICFYLKRTFFFLSSSRPGADNTNPLYTQVLTLFAVTPKLATQEKKKLASAGKLRDQNVHFVFLVALT